MYVQYSVHGYMLYKRAGCRGPLVFASLGPASLCTYHPMLMDLVTPLGRLSRQLPSRIATPGRVEELAFCLTDFIIHPPYQMITLSRVPVDSSQ